MRSLIFEGRALTEGWKKTPSGYEWNYKGHLAKVYKKKVKRSQHWFLDYKGETHSLGKKAEFGHAEGVLKSLA